MRFKSRQDAGNELGRWLRDKNIQADVVLGLPRGGVIVASEVARALQCPLDVLVVRKIGHPQSREFAVGALAEPDVVILDQDSIGKGSFDRFQLAQIIDEERQRLKHYQVQFRPSGLADLTDRTVVIVDDGLATGATAEAAIVAARKRGARTVIAAVPVGSVAAVERLGGAADRVEALVVDPTFMAVGQYYDEFSQTTDEEVIALLHIPAGSG
jgi:predicted phosphoribosyltransferase